MSKKHLITIKNFFEFFFSFPEAFNVFGNNSIGFSLIHIKYILNISQREVD